MSVALDTKPRTWTLAELHRRFGDMSFDRIRTDPAPGTGNEEDVVEIERREDLLYELIDGVLVRKIMGFYESILAIEIAALLRNFVRPRKLGVVAGPDGMIRLNPGLVRIPDVSFISIRQLPNRRMPRDPICPIIPDLAVEVLSAGNTRKEMNEKLDDYFNAGVGLVWFIDPDKRTVRVYTGRDHSKLLRENQTLDGGEVLPGFSAAIRALFAEPDDAQNE